MARKREGGIVPRGRTTARSDGAAVPHVVAGYRRALFEDDGGFTSLGVVVAMLLAVALVLATARVYWVESRSADIQFVADAGALAAEKVVADYLTVARVADATMLSMSLLGLSLYAVSAVAACIPAVGAGVSRGVLEAADSVMDARDRFADVATESLNALQRALPFLCVYAASSTVAANGEATGDADSATPLGIAIPLPLAGIEQAGSEVPASIAETGETARERIPSISEGSDAVEEASREMDEAKRIAFEADCGADPSYCLYQRAASLSTIASVDNPLYASMDGWTFSVPLQRARAYYAARLAREPGRLGGVEYGSDPSEAVRSIARARFYAYAIDTLASGSVTRDAQGVVHVDLPTLPANADDVRASTLYAANEWPLSGASGQMVLHAGGGCPVAMAQGVVGYGSLSSLDGGAFARCPVCSFDVQSLGSVPAASTSIDNGFEHYWRIIAAAARDYSDASQRYDEATRSARVEVEAVLGAFSEALGELDAPRFDAQPPGRYGTVVIAIDPSSHAVPQLGGGLDGGGAQMGARLAISAATLAPDDPTLADNLIASLLGTLAEDAWSQEVGADPSQRFLGSVLGGVLEGWGGLLLAYCAGTDGLLAGLTGILAGIPVVGGSLSQWAETRLRETIELAGLQPARLEMLKPVTCNTVHVVMADDAGTLSGLARLREGYTSLPGEQSGSVVTGAFEGAVGMVRTYMDDAVEGEYTIATIRLLDVDGFPEIPITVRLPASVGDRVSDAVFGLARRVELWGETLPGGVDLWR